MAHSDVRHERTPVSTLVLRAHLAVVLVFFGMVAVLDSSSFGEAQFIGIPVAVVIAYVLLGTAETRNALSGLSQRAAEVFCEVGLLTVDCGLLWATYVLVGEWVADLAVLVGVAVGMALGRNSTWTYRSRVRWNAVVGTLGGVGNTALTVGDPIDLTVKVMFVAIALAMLGVNLLGAYTLVCHLGPQGDLVAQVATKRAAARAERQWNALLAARRARRNLNIAKKRALRRSLGL